MGKTLGFWIPILFRPGGIQIVVTPLNTLGRQSAASLARAGIKGIAINADTATTANFTELTVNHKAIDTFEYRAIIVSPEQLMKPSGEFEKRLKNPLFTSRIISIIIDEAHCLTDWGEFRPEYKELRRLRYVLPMSIPVMIASATLTKDSLTNALQLLHMHPSRLVTIRRTTDRPNIKIGVKKIKYALNSYADLAFLIPPGWKDGDPLPPKFLIFFDDIQDAINAAQYLRRRLPPGMQDKIKWFNANMTTTYKDAEVTHFVLGETLGLATTESFGMGMDVPDIKLVIQWRATCKLPTLWQRFGRAARDKKLTGTSILFAEKEFFDDERAAKASRKMQRQSVRKRKGIKNSTAEPPAKRAKLNGTSATTVQPGASSMPNGMNVEGEVSDSEPEPDQESTHMPVINQGLDELEGALDEAARARKSAGRPEKRRKRELDLAMDYLINAENRVGLKCRRRVFDVCFENNAAEADHLVCDTERAVGCDRCRITPASVCCDIHHPDEFTNLMSSVPKPPPAPPRSRIPKYDPSPHDHTLRNALEEWREQTTSAVYGWHHLNDIGPCIVMCNATLERIVDCAHHHKISTIQDLKRETTWLDADQYGGEVLSLIRRHAAPLVSLFISTPLRETMSPSNVLTTSHASPSPTPNSIITRRKAKCSACGQEGHNARNRICPRRSSHAISAVGKENVCIRSDCSSSP
ncbi:P-loop containing nucleoside triphosphate hydrolase protein [Pisolithus microcarpus]|nr:P-loop containing nucleoside triphosphate hydrolase protein [Pisolithus microcarpus]